MQLMEQYAELMKFEGMYMNSPRDLDKMLYKQLEEKLIDSVVSRSYVFESVDEEEDQPEFLTLDERYGDDIDELDLMGQEAPVIDEEDLRILLHREAHFSGNFDFMLLYYDTEDHKGVHPDINISRIYELKEIEESIGKNLAATLLRGAEAEKVQRAKKMYRDMQEVLQAYSQENSLKEEEELPPHICLLEAILSEENIDTLVEKYYKKFEKSPSLLYPIIRSFSLYDELSPGYGLAPLFAIQVVGKLKDPGAMEPLFEQLYDISHEECPEIDEAIIEALKNIGAPVREKMLGFITQRPFGRDIEKAIQLLFEFLPDPDISSIALDQLLHEDIVDPKTQTYLVLLLASLPKNRQEEFQRWFTKNEQKLSQEVSMEVRYLLSQKK